MDLILPFHPFKNAKRQGCLTEEKVKAYPIFAPAVRSETFLAALKTWENCGRQILPDLKQGCICLLSADLTHQYLSHNQHGLKGPNLGSEEVGRG